eukprot:COSAG02_NODE_55364_length_291_cov_0.520833_1_plen_96_part_11
MLTCHLSYHYECANEDPRVALDHMTYECYCSAHSRQRPSYDLKPVDIPPVEYLELDPTDTEKQTESQKGGSNGNAPATRISVSLAVSPRAPPPPPP